MCPQKTRGRTASGRAPGRRAKTLACPAVPPRTGSTSASSPRRVRVCARNSASGRSSPGGLGVGCRISAAVRSRMSIGLGGLPAVEAQGLVDDVEGPALDLVVDAPQVLPDDAQEDELDATQEE